MWIGPKCMTPVLEFSMLMLPCARGKVYTAIALLYSRYFSNMQKSNTWNNFKYYTDEHSILVIVTMLKCIHNWHFKPMIWRLCKKN